MDSVHVQGVGEKGNERGPGTVDEASYLSIERCVRFVGFACLEGERFVH